MKITATNARHDCDDQTSVAVPSHPVELLNERLRWPVTLAPPPESRERPLHEWRMEENDAPILRYLYRHARPRRHLEFGTWEGRGALTCLQECEATVWTINLREGETSREGRWAYDAWLDESNIEEAKSVVTRTARSGRTVVRTDALGAIGHLVHEAGLGHRLCQIYCDSRQWDSSSLPDGFFDSVLIDGGHTEEVVNSDTLNALRLIRSGGLILWHDYCPDPLAQDTCSSIRGVVDAISRLAPTIRLHCRDWFWIQPSWILLGVRNDRPFDAGVAR